jgi:hypothetical protein
MRLSQAIFTSVRSERLDGYQLAARTPDITEDLVKDLTTWGPAHDSLWSGEPGATSINFHGLADGQCCLSQTTLSGEEYSGRGGGRVYTQMIVIPKDALARFANNPFLVLRALAASGRLMVYDQVPRELATIPLIGRADSQPEWIAEIISKAGAETIAELTEAVTADSPVTVITDLPVERLFQALLHQLQPAERLEVSFTTGLKPSSRRPFKLAISPDDPQHVRQSQRLQQGKLIEVLSCDSKSNGSRRRTTTSRSR